MSETYGKCCTCGKPLHRGEQVVRCSVSSCNAGRWKLVFCSPTCWNDHLATARHRKAHYVQEVAPR